MKLTMSYEISSAPGCSLLESILFTNTHTYVSSWPILLTKVVKVRGFGTNRSLYAAEFGIASNGSSVCLSEQRWYKPVCGRRNARPCSFASNGSS
jgi:hypothetical protein